MRAIICFSLLSLLPYACPLPLQSLQKRQEVPSFVLDYAPLLYLSPEEAYFPSDLATQLQHTHPEFGNFTDITTAAAPLTLSNLDTLNNFGTNVYLTSYEGIEALPAWFSGTVPPLASTQHASAIITVAKPNSILDAFYFYFYAYNQGDWVLNLPALEFGDHVGDWEHTMVRFVDGTPQAVWFSQHSDGEAFTYDAVQKSSDSGLRPLVYVAKGTHANYATPGTHDHTIPGLNLPVGPLEDHTDSGGPIWDPLLGALIYSYDVTSGAFSAYNGQDPTAWLLYEGCWGDPQLPDSTPGQIDVFGERKYVAGPTGPIDKNLDRTAVCPDADGCVVSSILTP